MPERGPHPCQHAAPYLEALRSFAARGPRRAMVPGHKGGGAADGGLRDALSAGRAGARPADAHRGRRRRGARRGRPVRGRTAAGGRGVGRPADVVSHQRRLAGQPGGLPGHRPARRAASSCSAPSTAARSTASCSRGCSPPSSPRRSTSSSASRTACCPRALDAALAAHARRGGGDRRLADLLRRCGRRRRPRPRRARPRRAARCRRGVGRAPGLLRRASAGTPWPPARTSSSRARTSTPAA